MRIKIEGLRQSDGGRLDISFGSAWGHGVAGWAGEMPSVGTEYDVELSVEGIVSVTDEMQEMERQDQIEFDSSGVIRICGIVESSEEGLLAMRLGSSMVLLEVSEGLPALGTWIRVSASKLVLYPLQL